MPIHCAILPMTTVKLNASSMARFSISATLELASKEASIYKMSRASHYSCVSEIDDRLEIRPR